VTLDGFILVTGGTGYIGSHTAKALARAGFLPIVFDNLSRGHEWAVKWGPLVRGDLGDANALDAAFAQYCPLAVIHFATFTYVGESIVDPLSYYRNNVLGTLSLLEAMQRAGCASIVFSSTCATYGIPEGTPITEDAPQNPLNPYGASKLMVERMLEDAGATCGIRSTRHLPRKEFSAAGTTAAGLQFGGSDSGRSVWRTQRYRWSTSSLGPSKIGFFLVHLFTQRGPGNR
jgi:UDP-arabinose 4-epimerase